MDPAMEQDTGTYWEDGCTCYTESEDGPLVITDRTQPTRWVRSDTYRALADMR